MIVDKAVSIIAMEGRSGRPPKPKSNDFMLRRNNLPAHAGAPHGETDMTFSTQSFDRFAMIVGNLAMLAALPFAAFAIFAHSI
jgi:hypothetical protein